MKKFYSLLIALLALVGVAQAQTFTKVTSTSDLVVGQQYLLVNEDAKVALGEISDAQIPYGRAVAVTISDGSIVITNEAVDILTLGGQATGWTFFSGLATGYLTWTSGNSLKLSANNDANAQWTIAIDANGNVTPTNVADNTRILSFNATNPRFAAYGNANQKRVQLYTAGAVDPSFVASPKITPVTGTYYDAQTVTMSCATDGATIYYTTDGNVPTTESTVYTEPFTIEETTNIKALAVKGEYSSAVVEELITIDQATTKTIAEILADGPANGVQASATVVAVSSIGVLLQDNTGYIFKYTGTDPGVAVGDVVTVIGETKEYGGRLQFTENGSMEKTGTETVSYPTAVVLNGAAFDALVANVQIQYIEVAATVSGVGNYYNLTISGATSTGSLIAASDVLSQLKVNDQVKITGFFVYVTGTTKKYGYIIATKVDLPQVDYTEYNTLAAVKAAAPADEASATYAQLNVDNLLVSYVNGQSVYLFDGEDGMLIYGTNSKNLKTGDKISGNIKGKLYKRNGNTQLASSAYEVTVVSSGNDVVPQEVSPAVFNATGATYENELITLKGLVPNAEALDNKNITFKYEDEDEEVMYTFAVRDNFNVVSSLVFDKNKAYTVTGLVAVYTKEGVTTIQIYPRTAADIDNGEPPVVYEFVGDGTLENAYIVADIQHKEATDTKTALEKNVWVKAYIVGYINGSNLNASTAVFSADAPEGATVAPSNLLVADAADAKTAALVIPVALPTGGARTDLNLADNPSKLGTQVWLKGGIYKYMGVPGLKDVKVYSLDGSVIVDAINGITLDASAAKTIYNVAGQRVQNLSKAGLYIVNGKKVVVK